MPLTLAYIAIATALEVPCAYTIPPAKLEKMVSWTVRAYPPVNIAHARAIGQHAARYACRKRGEMRGLARGQGSHS